MLWQNWCLPDFYGLHRVFLRQIRLLGQASNIILRKNVLVKKLETPTVYKLITGRQLEKYHIH